jgi:hypothetical protein
MKLDVRAAALAAGGIAAVAYALCTVFCAVAPEPTVAYLGNAFFHVDLTGLYQQMTWRIFVIGILEAGVGTSVVVGATAWLYNRLAQNEIPGSLPDGQSVRR